MPDPDNVVFLSYKRDDVDNDTSIYRTPMDDVFSNHVREVYYYPEANILSMLLTNISYSAVLQQFTRHRSFAYSVESSRAHKLNLSFMPIWRMQTDGKMFDAGIPSRSRVHLLDTLWMVDRTINMFFYKLYTALGVHRQHAQLPIKPYAVVDMFVTGNTKAWEHFIDLRDDEKKGTQSDIVDVAQSIKRAYSNVIDAVSTQAIPHTPTSCSSHGRYTMRYHIVERLKPNTLYGPRLISHPLTDDLSSSSDHILDDDDIATAIASVTRISTGSHNRSSTQPNTGFVKWLAKNKHASPFEHFWLYTPGERYGYLQNAKNLRYVLDLDAW